MNSTPWPVTEVLAQGDDPVVPVAVAGLVGELGDVLADGGDVLVAALGHDRLLVSCRPGPALGVGCASGDRPVGSGGQLVVEVVGLVLGEIDQVGLGVISEHEPDPFVVPAVELSRSRRSRCRLAAACR